MSLMCKWTWPFKSFSLILKESQLAFALVFKVWPTQVLSILDNESFITGWSKPSKNKNRIWVILISSFSFRNKVVFLTRTPQKSIPIRPRQTCHIWTRLFKVWAIFRSMMTFDTKQVLLSIQLLNLRRWQFMRQRLLEWTSGNSWLGGSRVPGSERKETVVTWSRTTREKTLDVADISGLRSSLPNSHAKLEDSVFIEVVECVQVRRFYLKVEYLREKVGRVKLSTWRPYCSVPYVWLRSRACACRKPYRNRAVIFSHPRVI